MGLPRVIETSPQIFLLLHGHKGPANRQVRRDSIRLIGSVDSTGSTGWDGLYRRGSDIRTHPANTGF
jgi:hypothetical protein